MKILNLPPPTSLQQNSYNHFLHAKLSGSQIISHWKSRQNKKNMRTNLSAYISLFPEKFPFFFIGRKVPFCLLHHIHGNFRTVHQIAKEVWGYIEDGLYLVWLSLLIKSLFSKKKKKKWCAYTSNCLQPKLLDPLLNTLVSQVSCMHNNW